MAKISILIFLSLFLISLVFLFYPKQEVKAQGEPFIITERTEYGLTENTVYLNFKESMPGGKDQYITNLTFSFVDTDRTRTIEIKDFSLNQSYQSPVYGWKNITKEKCDKLNETQKCWEIYNNLTTKNETYCESIIQCLNNDKNVIECDYIKADKSCLDEVYTNISYETKYDYLDIPKTKEKTIKDGLKIEQKVSGSITLAKGGSAQIKVIMPHLIFYGLTVPYWENKYNITACSQHGCVELDPTWWNSTWTRKAGINITNSGSSALTDYQVAINLTYDSDMVSDFSDIRFVNGSENTELSYWLESKVDSSWAYIWVKIPNIPTGTNQNLIYVYYKNASVVSSKSNENTFLFFDNFTSTTLDPTWTWSPSGHGDDSYSLTTVPGKLRIVGGYTGSHEEVSLMRRIAESGDYAIDVNMTATWDTNYYNSGGYAGDGVSSSAGNRIVGQVMHESSATPHETAWVEKRVSGVRTVADIVRFNEPSFPTTVLLRFAKVGTNFNTSVRVDGVWHIGTILSYTADSTYSGITANNDAGTSQPTFTADFDDFRTRKYTYPEPTYSIGAEETPNQPPTLSAVWESPTDPATYSPGATYRFNITACDVDLAADISKVLFEWNGGTNVSITDYVTHNTTCRNYTTTKTDLGVGTYNYKWFANDTANAWANVITDSYTVADTTPPNITWESPTPDNATTISNNYVYLNTTIADASNTSAFFNWNYSLVGYWAMDWYNSTGIYDNSTYNNFGTFNGVNFGTSNITTGKYGKALKFDGMDDYIDGGNDSSVVISSGITIETWIKPQPDQEYCWDGSKGNYGVAASVNNYTGSTTWSWQLRYGAPTTCYLGFQFNGNPEGAKWVTIGQNLTAETWYHVVGTFNGTHIKSYLNGTLVETSTISAITTNPNNKILIGTEGWANYFNGTIDEVRIWNRALSPEEINASYNNGLYRLYHNFTSLSQGTYNYYAYAIDTAGNANKTGTRIITVADTTPPNITFISQEPSDIDTLNVLGKSLLNITYNISDVSGVNNVIFYYKVNTTTEDKFIYINGTPISGYQVATEMSNVSDIWNFTMQDNEVYPATYNFNETEMRITPREYYDLDANNEYIKIRLFNVTNLRNYSFFEINAINQTPASGSLRIYYCNESYTSGNPVGSNNCINFYNLPAGIVNHSHSNYSNHSVIPFAINITTGMIGDVHVTNTSYFLLRGRQGTNAWNISYITNISRTDTIQTSTNTGNSWSNFAGTMDAHLHQYDGSDTFYYYVCANDTLLNSNCSAVRYDLIDLAGLPPIAPEVYNPVEGLYSGNIIINYTASLSPNSYPISFYNISLVNIDETFNMTIKSNNYLNLSYVWDSTVAEDGRYVIRVEACDNLSQCSFGYSENISVDNTLPTYSLNSTNSTLAGTPVNHSLFWQDETGLSHYLFSFDNCTGTLVNDTIWQYFNHNFNQEKTQNITGINTTTPDYLNVFDGQSYNITEVQTGSIGGGSAITTIEANSTSAIATNGTTTEITAIPTYPFNNSKIPVTSGKTLDPVAYIRIGASDTLEATAYGTTALDSWIKVNYTLPANAGVNWIFVNVSLRGSAANDNLQLRVFNWTNDTWILVNNTAASITSKRLIFNISEMNVTHFISKNITGNVTAILLIATGSTSATNLLVNHTTITVNYITSPTPFYGMEVEHNTTLSYSGELINMTVNMTFLSNVTSTFNMTIFNFATGTWDYSKCSNGTVIANAWNSWTCNVTSNALNYNSSDNEVKVRLNNSGQSSPGEVSIDYINHKTISYKQFENFVPFGSLTGWSNVTKTINSTVGCTIRWCVYANDTSNNWNGTSCISPFSYVTTSGLQERQVNQTITPTGILSKISSIIKQNTLVSTINIIFSRLNAIFQRIRTQLVAITATITRINAIITRASTQPITLTLSSIRRIVAYRLSQLSTIITGVTTRSINIVRASPVAPSIQALITKSVLKTITQPLAIIESLARVLTSFRQQLLAPSIDVTVSRTIVLIKESAKQITMQTAILRSIIAQRVSTILPAISLEISRFKTSIKEVAQAIQITVVLEKISHMFKTLVGTVQIQGILARIIIAARGVSQPITLILSAIRRVAAYRISQLALAISTTISRLNAVISKQIIQSLSALPTLTKLEKAIRASTQTISLTIGMITTRIPKISQIITLAGVLMREVSATRLQAITVQIAGLISRQAFAERIQAVGINIIEVVGRTTYAVKELPVAVILTDAFGRIGNIIREAPQIISIIPTVLGERISTRFLAIGISVADILTKIAYTARTSTGAIVITDLVQRAFSTARELSQAVNIQVLLESINIRISAITISITDIANRVAMISKTVLASVIASIVLKVVSPARYWLTLVSPNYSLFEWATRAENLILILLGVGSISAFSLYYTFIHRRELIETPLERYFGSERKEKKTKS